MMKLITSAVVLGAWFAAPVMAQESQSTVQIWTEDPTQHFEAGAVAPDDLVWTLRPLVVFADSPLDPRYQQQIDLLLAGAPELAERDVIVITDTAPAEMTEYRTALRPRGFMLALLSKDGTVLLRRPSPQNVRELSASIDKIPLRQQEVEDRRAPPIR